MTRVLFVCVENACRSQMAEAFARRLGAGRFEACSAGSRPAGSVNPRAIAFMAERGYDLNRNASKPLSAFEGQSFNAVVTMGCGDACPWLPAARRVDWDLPDPKVLPDEGFRAVRDEIEHRVRQLLSELGVSAQETPR
ncbi:MAG TPA: arsenate reductase ArsC [Rhodanobacteraceae bacterium]|nr:arsenate reductase ArsC [Rhodanobacteraceae bacterium]